MLTILAMVNMGPWTLTYIHRLPGRDERCQRCETPIKWVWVMELKTEQKNEIWRIGSCCGPQLEDMTAELWESTRPFHNRIEHVRRLDRLAEMERQHPNLRPQGYELGWAEQQIARIAAGGYSRHEQKVMGSQISRRHQAYSTSIQDALRRGAEATAVMRRLFAST